MNKRVKRKIGLIGCVDLDRTMFDGQTVKTRMVYRLLCEMFGKNHIITVDTKDYRYHPLRVASATFRCLVSCESIFVLLSENGRRTFFPLLSFMANHCDKRIYHILIGGLLDQNLDRYPKWLGYLNNFEVNWVESHRLAEVLMSKGVNNARYLQNFKYYDSQVRPNTQPIGPDYRFCTFSRVMNEKGIGDAIQAVEIVSQRYKAGRVSLDVYGPIDEEYRETFESLLEKNPCAHYCGCVSPEKGVDVISNYDALLFPTKWKPEGIPGTIIDALAAGVPIIASKWNYYDEMLEDDVTGIGYEFGRQECLESCIDRFISNGQRVVPMRAACLRRSSEYSPRVVSKKIRKALRCQ